MKNKEMEKFINQELPEYVNALRFDLRHKDVLLSAKLLKAADNEDWKMVSELLEQGADPRICRISDGTSCESALYLAMKAKEFKVAETLFEAGDRLDDLHVGELALPAEVLDFLAYESAHGRNYFIEEEKPLSECIRCGLWNQIGEKIANAPQEELDLSLEMIGFHLQKWNADAYLEILRDLQKHGADIARFRGELLEEFDRFPKMPKIFRPEEVTFRQIVKLIREA